MKILTRNYFIFVTICILSFVYFYFNQYFYTINVYDTYYLISYFFFVLPILIIGTTIFLLSNFYSKFEKMTRNYLIFVTICILLFIYFYFFDKFYIMFYQGKFYFIRYFYFVLPTLIIGTIFYFVKKKAD